MVAWVAPTHLIRVRVLVGARGGVMKEIHQYIVDYFGDYSAEQLVDMGTVIRNEAFDAAIEAVEKAYEIEIERFEQYGEISAGTGNAIKAIEELKGKK